MKEIFTLLNPNNTVTINRPLAHAVGLNEAIIFAALAAKQSYYEERGMLDDEGFFYSTVADLEESTALSRHRQSAAIKNLVETGLIETMKKGMPAKRCFKVNEDISLLEALLKNGEEKMTELNPLANSSPKSGEQESEKSADKRAENQTTSQPKNGEYINPNNKSKINETKENQSVYPAAAPLDTTDETDIFRGEYLQVIRENIEYETFSDQKQVDELVEIMLDVVCSSKDTVRVNGEEVPTDTVRSRFLKLDSSHIEYVLTALKKSAPEIKNIRAYLITALYNAPATIDNYYAAWVNHDMFGK